MQGSGLDVHVKGMDICGQRPLTAGSKQDWNLAVRLPLTHLPTPSQAWNGQKNCHPLTLFDGTGLGYCVESGDKCITSDGPGSSGICLPPPQGVSLPACPQPVHTTVPKEALVSPMWGPPKQRVWGEVGRGSQDMRDVITLSPDTATGSRQAMGKLDLA